MWFFSHTSLISSTQQAQAASEWAGQMKNVSVLSGSCSGQRCHQLSGVPCFLITLWHHKTKLLFFRWGNWDGVVANDSMIEYQEMKECSHRLFQPPNFLCMRKFKPKEMRSCTWGHTALQWPSSVLIVGPWTRVMEQAYLPRAGRLASSI